ncbi:MAG: hypothetical protein WC378_18970 [Opitutaceae bacterium]|jgi:hypothetical protein
MDTTKLKVLQRASNAAQRAVEAECRRLWPERSLIRFNIQADQKNPTQGEVLCHSGSEMRVTLFSTYRTVKSVHWTHIL